MSDYQKARQPTECQGCGEVLNVGDDVFVREGEEMCEGCAEDYDDGERCWEDDEYPIDGVGFADPGGTSALRAETEDNPRNLPCGGCGRENVLTPLDKQAGYVCDVCADQAERGY
jgi:formylmethanofuran dehydrogenase subunit E